MNMHMLHKRIEWYVDIIIKSMASEICSSSAGTTAITTTTTRKKHRRTTISRRFGLFEP